MHYVPVRLSRMIQGIDLAGCEELPESSIIIRRGYLCV
jgi:hypothetical protein